MAVDRRWRWWPRRTQCGSSLCSDRLRLTLIGASPGGACAAWPTAWIRMCDRWCHHCPAQLKRRWKATSDRLTIGYQPLVFNLVQALLVCPACRAPGWNTRLPARLTRFYRWPAGVSGRLAAAAAVVVVPILLIMISSSRRAGCAGPAVPNLPFTFRHASLA